MSTVKQMVAEAADKAMPDSFIREGFAVNSGEYEDGELVPMFHGSGAANFNEFNIPDYEGALGKGAYFTSVFEEACDYAISELGIEENEDGLYEWGGDTYDYGSLCEELESKGFVRPFYLNITEENDYDDSKYGNGGIIAVARNASQIKSADPITYDDNGDVIPLSERFDSTSSDIRFSIVEDNNGEYNVDELKASLKERFKEYETDEGNLKLATEVVADIGKIRLSVDGDVDGVRRNTSGIRTIAKGISEQFINEGYIDFRGIKVNDPEDVAAMMQVCR